MYGERGDHGVRPSSQSIGLETLHPGTDAQVVRHPVGELPMAETLLTEVEHKASSRPGNDCWNGALRKKKELSNSFVVH
jgi:hypothetical protein